MRIHPVIMAGGSGTRFWPLSRRTRPKQFLPLASEEPLIVDTFRRLGPLAAETDTLVVCGRMHEEKVRALLPASRVVVEPEAKNTAPAIGLAALHVAHVDPKGVMLVLPSDHHIADVEGFRRCLSAAARLAFEGMLTTIGLTPMHPETGFGYIRTGASLGRFEGLDTVRVAGFVEKPNRETAEKYLSSGDYLWNAGIFALRVDVILAEIERHLPKLHAALEALRPTIGTELYEPTLEKVFASVESISIDYGIMERAAQIACVPGGFGWNDVGSFAALAEVKPLDGAGNLVEGEHVLVDCEGCVVIGSSKPIAAIGLRDLVIVDTGDTLLVVPKSRAQDVRKAVEALETRGKTSLL